MAAVGTNQVVCAYDEDMGEGTCNLLLLPDTLPLEALAIDD